MAERPVEYTLLTADSGLSQMIANIRADMAANVGKHRPCPRTGCALSRQHNGPHLDSYAARLRWAR